MLLVPLHLGTYKGLGAQCQELGAEAQYLLLITPKTQNGTSRKNHLMMASSQLSVHSSSQSSALVSEIS